jgi:transcriptional regulator with XRE-family HTH domain
MARRLRISRPTLNRLESTSQNATLKTLDQLCRALRCEPGDLFRPRPGPFASMTREIGTRTVIRGATRVVG